MLFCINYKLTHMDISVTCLECRTFQPATIRPRTFWRGLYFTGECLGQEEIEWGGQIFLLYPGRARLSNGLEINRMSPGRMCSSDWNYDAG